MMIRLDDPEKWLPKLDECAERTLSDEELVQFAAIPADNREKQLRALLTAPIANFTVINEAYFRARWGEVMGYFFIRYKNKSHITNKLHPNC